MSKADEIRAKAERLRKQREASDKPAVTSPSPSSSPPAADKPTAEDRERHLAKVAAPLAKPVRSTVDLPPVQHAQLKAWLGETAVMIGKSRVTTQDVMRAMVARLLTDETLARKVREDLRASS